MTSPSRRRPGRGGVAAVCVALVAAPLTLTSPATAAAPNHLVISEAYLNGGSAGATYKNKYVELYNPTGASVDVSGMSLQYRSATGTDGPTTTLRLTGSVPAGGYYLVQGSSNGTGGADLPAPDLSGTFNPAAGGGTIVLADQSAPLTVSELPLGDNAGNTEVVDLLGYGTSNTYETTVDDGGNGVTKSLARAADGTDTGVNRTDFSAGDLTPKAPPVVVTPPVPAVARTIEEIQGTEATSPYDGTAVITRGVVTAAYPTGGLSGFNLQTEGTGADVDLDSPRASDGIFVYLGSGASAADYPSVGEFVEVTGTVKESFGLTEITARPADVTAAPEPFDPVTPAEVVWPSSTAQRESLEGMLLAPQGAYTVTDNYSTNRYGEIGLARGTKPLRQPTDVARPGAAATAVATANAAKAVVLDDGSSFDYLPTDPAKDANKDVALPYLKPGDPVRVGAGVTFTKPVVLDYQFSKYRFQPTEQVTGPDSTQSPATFENTRTDRPDAVGGDLRIASFNVLNYFPETAEKFVAAGSGHTCTTYDDRDGDPVTANTCAPDGPRGAAEDEDLTRQQDKIVTAINKLGADVLSLEEIENSAKYNHDTDRDAALNRLVAALNTAAGSEVWAAAPSPRYRPQLAEEDVIRTAFIYKQATVETVGASQILTGSGAFASAREPLAQVFRPRGGKVNQQFLAVVNHFKSKSSGTGADADLGDGQGGSNASRVAQAKALVPFVKDVQESSNTKQVFLIGDFNAYTREDPMQVLYDAGYTDLGSTLTDETTYQFGGTVGSLDHVLANASALRQVTGADVWNINSVESPAFEYSRDNYNVTDFYTPDQFRSSDHDPLVVGFTTPGANKDVTVNLLNINDFHGRIDSTTVGWAATIEKLRQSAGPDGASTLLSAGDNIGASLFASSSDGDLPTLKVLNKLELRSSVGNHEFDKGYDDLVGRVSAATDWSYVGANVYLANGERALPAYDIVTVNGVRVGVIGAVTEETPSLVTPSGIDGLQFRDPVDEVNKAAAELTDGVDTAGNGEADIVVAEYHEGAPEGTPEGATLDKELAASPVFQEIVTQTSPKVAAIFTAHTHKQYAWDAQVPGATAGVTRPVLQTGSYGETIGRVTLTVDSDTKKIASYTAGLTPRLTVSDLNGDKRTDGADQTIFDTQVVAAYGPRVADVKTIVDDALARANVAGAPKVGQIGHDVTTAYTSGSYVGGRYTVADPRSGRDDRTSESALGNTVANMLRDTMATERYGNAEIGVVNPGGLRAELLYAGTNNPSTDTDGVVTTGEAVSVLPFANNLFTVRLTGAQLKQVLEQQWQRNVDGTVPSRSFLHLGLSDNVQTTLDPTRPEGSRVTSVTVDGVPLDPARTYTIGTFSFLATGGDNFRAFKQGPATDTGLVDTDGWFGYLGRHQSPALEPSFARRQVFGTGIPASIEAGQAVSFTLGKLDLTSLGSPANAAVDVVLRNGSIETPVGTPTPVTNGTANVSFTAPASIPAGSVFVVTARPSGTSVTIPATATVAPAQDTTTTATASPSPVVVRATEPVVTAVVTAADGTPAAGGTVNVYVDGENRGTAAVADGTARVQLPAFDTTGSQRLVVEYTGVTGVTNDSATSIQVDVVRATPTLQVAVQPDVIRKNRTMPVLDVRVSAPGQVVSGNVVVRQDGTVLGLGTLVDGSTGITLPPYKKRGQQVVTVEYLGSDLAEGVTQKVTFTVGN